MELSAHLAEYVNIPVGSARLKRILRIGFSAGYLGLPLPDVARVTARDSDDLNAL